MMDRFLLPEIVNNWIRGSEVGLVEAFMEWWAQQVLPTMCISWLNISDDLDKMLSSEMRRYFCLLPELSYSLPSSFTNDVLVQGLITDTYSVVLRDLFSHCAVEPLLEMRVETTVAVVLAILVTVLMLELVSPFPF